MAFLLRVHSAVRRAVEDLAKMSLVPDGAQHAVLVGAVLVQLQPAEHAARSLVAAPHLSISHVKQLPRRHGNQPRQSHVGVLVLLHKAGQRIQCVCVYV